MRVLIVKMSSMGDIIHTLPAVTDAAKAIANIQFDWVAEEAFTEIPRWHQRVDKVIPIALRRWRKQLWQATKSGEVRQFYQKLRSQRYDFVLDAQGSIKSAIITRLSCGYRLGMDKNSVREGPAYLAYQQSFSISRQQHAIIRLRQLFAKAFNYTLPTTRPDYAINKESLILPKIELTKNYLIFVPNASGTAKHWSDKSWSLLLAKMAKRGVSVFIPWGSEAERKRVARLVKGYPLAHILPYLNLDEMAAVLSKAKAVVSVDTGLSHLAAALGIPTMVLYGPTNPLWIGTIGPSQLHLKIQAEDADGNYLNQLALKKIEDKLEQILTR
ncbi:MAG: lipopolysaccharide heptosyltransferase [Pseudomonadota bacterium]|jgi:heptosyltransferase-1